MSLLAEYLEMLHRIESELLELKYHASLLDLQLTLRALNQAQPRLPGGGPGGGQYTFWESGDPSARVIDVNEQPAKNPAPPPGYDANTWKEGRFSDGKKYIEDPEGNRYVLHAEDGGHWRHWDKQDKDGNPLGRVPRNSLKPRAGQKRLKDDQSTTDPSGDAPPWTPRELPDRTPIPVLPVDPSPVPEFPFFEPGMIPEIPLS